MGIADVMKPTNGFKLGLCESKRVGIKPKASSNRAACCLEAQNDKLAIDSDNPDLSLIHI